MTIEQKRLLYEIAMWHKRQFFNNVEDHWTAENHRINDKCIYNIINLEKEYKDLYGPLPEWKYFDDIWETIKTLKKELDEYDS